MSLFVRIPTKVTTDMIVNGAVTKEKLGPGILIESLNSDHTSSSFTLTGGGEQEILSVSGIGFAMVHLTGNGDGTFKIRVYRDGSTTPDAELPTNEEYIGGVTFTTGISIKVYNPGTTSKTASSETIRVRAIKR